MLVTKIKEDEMGDAYTIMIEARNSYKILVRKPEGRRLFGIPRYIQEDNIKMDLR